MEEAKAAPPYTCQRCEAVAKLRAEFESRMQEESEGRGLAIAAASTRLEEMFNASTKELKVLEAQLGEERKARETLEEMLHEERKAREASEIEFRSLVEAVKCEAVEHTLSP